MEEIILIATLKDVLVVEAVLVGNLVTEVPLRGHITIAKKYATLRTIVRSYMRIQLKLLM